MVWDQEGVEMPIKKPHQLIELEQMSLENLEAMTQEEVHSRIENAADALALNYMQERGESYEDCIEIVSTFLETSGGPIGGKVGAALVARGLPEATRACRYYYAE